MSEFQCAHCGEYHPYGKLVIPAVGEHVEPKPPEDPEVRAWVKHIVELTTPKREFGANGDFLGWVNPKEST